MSIANKLRRIQRTVSDLSQLTFYPVIGKQAAEMTAQVEQLPRSSS